MTASQFNWMRGYVQLATSQVAEILDSIDATEIVSRLEEYRAKGGPKTYPVQAFWRAYLLTFLLDLSSINALLRRLDQDPLLTALCGFSKLPHRTTFNRFVTRLSQHRDLVDEALTQATDELKALLPDLGETVAVDSTTIRTNSHPHRKSPKTGQLSDPEASWTAKPAINAQGKKDKDWRYGYKLHLVADAVHEVPLASYVTTASQNDSPEMPKLLEQAESRFSWFQPKHVLADRGYDAQSNHEYVLGRDGAFICPMRAVSGQPNYQYGVFNKDGVPSCVGNKLMEYQGTLAEKGHLYRCQAGGCHLNQRKGVVYCQDWYWVDWRTEPNKRLHGPVRRGTAEWEALYSLRQSVERAFKSMKESRRLERHYVRGLAKVSLHASMSVLAYTATMLAKTRAQAAYPRWMVDKVA